MAETTGETNCRHALKQGRINALQGEIAPIFSIDRRVSYVILTPAFISSLYSFFGTARSFSFPCFQASGLPLLSEWQPREARQYKNSPETEDDRKELIDTRLVQLKSIIFRGRGFLMSG